MFAYKLLEKLGVGPEIQFIANELDSRQILYIADTDIPNFKTIKQIEWKEEVDLSKYAKAVTQMLSLYTVLDMTDDHSANMGVDINGSPFIVDFIIRGYPLDNVKTDLHDNIRETKKIK